MRRKNGGDASAKRGEDDKECRRECWTAPQNHEANDVGRRSADSEGGRRRRENVGSLCGEEERLGKTLAMSLGNTEYAEQAMEE